MNKTPNVFVIMPFNPEFTPIYEQLIKPALEDVGYNVHRADSFFDQRNILRDIVRGIINASFVVAELTSLNPNVLYELGLCHGLRIPTILIAQSIDEVPFDLRSYRTLVYSTQFDKVGELKTSLQEIATRHLNNEITFGNPVTDFSPRDYQGVSNTTNSQKDFPKTKHTEEIQEESGFIDFLVEGVDAANQMTEMLNTFSTETMEITNKFNQHTLSFQQIADNPGPGSTAQMHKVATYIATDMNSYNAKVTLLLPEYESSVESFIDNYTGYINWLPPDSEQTIQQINTIRESMKSLLDNTTSGIGGVSSFRDALKQIKGISRNVNRESALLIVTLTTLLTNFEKIVAFCTKSLIILDEKISISSDK